MTIDNIFRPAYIPAQRLVATLALLLAFVVARAQLPDSLDHTGTGLRQHSFVVGGGSADVLDTYLSPYAYKGGSLRMLRETLRPTRLLTTEDRPESRVALQTLLDIELNIVENPARNADSFSGGLRYSLGWLYRLHRRSWLGAQLDFAAGPMLSAYLGVVYNDRNVNNPAQAKADLMLDLTASATAHFRWLQRSCALRYQLSVPTLGMAFSPAYGQSYYEAFYEGNHDHNLVCATFVNMPSMRHLLTFDIQLRRCSATALRLGYGATFMQSEFNHLRYHSYTHTFMVGVTKTFKRL